MASSNENSSSARYYLTDNDLLYYLHIPKTAGTSFTDVLKDNFKPEESSFSEFIGKFLKFSPERMENLRAFSGHYFYNIIDFTQTQRKPVYITILRDPVERTISNYAYIQRLTVHYAHDIVKSQTLLEFVSDPRTKYLYANSQTRYLAADPNTLEISNAIVPDPLKPSELLLQMESYAPTGFDDPTLLERAEQRLKDFAFVGLAEQFDESIELLGYTFGWTVPEATKVFNVSPNRPAYKDIPQEALDIIRENTQLDAALYALGKQIFETRYAQMLKDRPEKIRQNVSSENADVAELRQQIDFQKRHIATLQEENLALLERIRTLSKNIREPYENSWGWRFILRFNKLRLKLIPHGSKRENIYLKIRGQ